MPTSLRTKKRLQALPAGAVGKVSTPSLSFGIVFSQPKIVALLSIFWPSCFAAKGRFSFLQNGEIAAPCGIRCDGQRSAVVAGSVAPYAGGASLDECLAKRGPTHLAALGSNDDR